MGFFCLGLKNEFEITMVNKPSLFEPPKFYCIYILGVSTEKPLEVHLLCMQLVVYTLINLRKMNDVGSYKKLDVQSTVCENGAFFFLP